MEPGKAIWSWRGDDAAVADYVAAHIRSDRPSTIAVAGGHTPGPILGRLRRRALPWNRACFVPTDERLVPPAHPDSNYGMLSRALDDTPALIGRLGETNPASGFDLVWLGMGEDGKIASLFTTQDAMRPGCDTVIRTRPAAASRHAAHERASLSLDAICRARDVILVIRGRQKRRLVESALSGKDDLAVSRLFSAMPFPVRIFWCP
ncbi:6-phosphogluconolactonase [Rhizorhabdus histidinilytica]